MDFQTKIDKLIESKGLTKTGLAKIIGVSRDTVYNLDKNTKIDTYLKICQALNVNISDLISVPVTHLVEESKEHYVPKNVKEIIKLRGKKTLEIDIETMTLRIK